MSKFRPQFPLTEPDIQKYLKTIASLNVSDFYSSMKMCALKDSDRPESEMGWFVICKIKDYLIKRYEMSEVRIENVFRKAGKHKKKKEPAK